VNRFALKSLVKVLLLFIAVGAARPQRAQAYPQAGGSLQAAKPCRLVTKAEAESIVGASLVVRRNTDDECWYIESGFTNPAGPKNKQLYLNIWHFATPQRDDVRTTRANIADRQPTAVTRDLPGFADAALWSWMPGAGRLSAFKGGTIGVDVMVGGIAEGAALQHAKVLAARALGGAAKAGFAYEGAAPANAAQVRGVAASAREIWRFDKLAGDDQIEYVNLLIDSVQAATRPDQLAQVKRFFMSKQSGETISGMGQFELNLSLARVADLEAVEKNAKVRRLEVEDVMYVTLERNGIVLPKGFRPAAINFQPKNPPSKTVMTKEESYKALAQTRAWVARTVPVERELPHGPMFSNNAAGLAFFRALADLQAKARANGADGSYPSTDVATHENDPWWEKKGYNSYHEAAQAACHQVPADWNSMTLNGKNAISVRGATTRVCD
jgi:hypothetical protein